jgi:hypothetical protein
LAVPYAVLPVSAEPRLDVLGDGIRQSLRKLLIAEAEGWTSARVGTLAEDLAGRALTQIGVRAGPRTWAQPTFKIMGASPHDSPHGLYRALIFAHGERLAWPGNGVSLGNTVTRSHC